MQNDKPTQYRHIMREVLSAMQGRAQPKGYEEYEDQLVTDDEHGHYFLMSVGWRGDERMHGCVVHLDLRGNQIWIQRDGTDWGIAHDLMERGVPKADIVLAFQSPYRRQFSEFGLAEQP
jgi:hypothetical protein